MKIYKISQQYQTKDGRPITFKELPFNEANDKRGWVVHKIEAYVNGEYAGYINLSYIPKEKWNDIYKGNIWRFRDLALGHSDVPDELLNASDEAIAKDHADKYGFSSKYWMESEKEKATQEYKMYELYFVDKPIVDFIRTEEKFQRQRVSYALHQYANEWLKNNFGLHLWLSYCRTDNGKCFYDSKLLELKKYKYPQKMTDGYRRTREYVAENNSWYKIAKAETLNLDDLPLIADEGEDDPEIERAKKYFNIGHGDFVDEFGYNPNYQIWIMLYGEIEKSKVFKVDPEKGDAPDAKTHRMLWGSLEDTNYKGRYEPQTGRLTIVKPDFARFRDIPHEVMNKIKWAFPRTKKIIVASNIRVYKTAKKKFDSYYEIGHDGYNKYHNPTGNDFLWIYLDNKIKYHPITSRFDVHTRIWPDSSLYNYGGRFDANRKLVSIVNPFEGREIPNIIISKLYDTFGNDIEIAEF